MDRSSIENLTTQTVEHLLFDEIPSESDSITSDISNDDIDNDPDYIDELLGASMEAPVYDDNQSSSEDEAPSDVPTNPAPQSSSTWDHINRYLPSSVPDFNSMEGPSALFLDLNEPSPFDIFQHLFDESIIENLVFNTNLYAQQEGKRYTPTTSDEIRTFLGINLLMGIKRMPSYRDHWSSQEDMNDPYISKLMSVNRFGWILSHLHVNDNAMMPRRDAPNYDKLYKIRPLLSKLQENYMTYYKPSSTLAVDESMIKFKGRSDKKQYMPKKPIKRGYKVWVLADKNGYMVKFEIYTGKIGNRVERNLGASVVLRMTSELENLNHRVYFDNYFTSVDLLQQLKNKGIHACGTVNKSRVQLPKFILEKGMKRGDSKWWCKGDSGVIATQWMDNRCVYMLSNFHNPEASVEIIRRQRNGSSVRISCPKIVCEYNANMNCVDKFDQKKKVYEIDRKSHKWWHRIFFYFLDATVVNAHVIYNQLTNDKLSLKNFRRRVIDGLVAKRIIETSSNQRKSLVGPVSKKKKVSQEIRLQSSDHQPKRSTRRRCALCSTKKTPVRSNWECSTCKVALCLVGKTKDCFQKFHSVANLN